MLDELDLRDAPLHVHVVVQQRLQLLRRFVNVVRLLAEQFVKFLVAWYQLHRGWLGGSRLDDAADLLISKIISQPSPPSKGPTFRRPP